MVVFFHPVITVSLSTSKVWSHGTTDIPRVLCSPSFLWLMMSHFFGTGTAGHISVRWLRHSSMPLFMNITWCALTQQSYGQHVREGNSFQALIGYLPVTTQCSLWMGTEPDMSIIFYKAHVWKVSHWNTNLSRCQCMMGVRWNWRSNRFYIDTAVLDNMDLPVPPPHTPTHTIKHILSWCTNVLNSHLLSFYVSNCTRSSIICWYFLLASTCTEAPKQPSVDFSLGKYMYWTVICCYSLLASIGTQQLPVVILCWHVQVLGSHLLIFSVGKYTVLNSHMLTPSVGR